MKNKLLILIVLFSNLWFSCEKELNITEFKDDFGDYEPELKIEGILQQNLPEESIVRVIRTSSITDVDVFDGKDNDNDGEIDEYDEVLPLVQDTSAIVKVINLTTSEEFQFEYFAVADSFVYWVDEEEFYDSEQLMIPYGGFKPTSKDFQVKSGDRYKLEVFSEDFDQTISGETTVYSPVEFIDTLHSFQDSIVFLSSIDGNEIFWKSDPEVTAYFVRFQEIHPFSETEFDSEYLFGFPNSRDNDLSKKYKNYSIGRQTIWGMFPGTILGLTVEALSPEYGNYIFSGLPMNDPQRTNLRDQDGHPVLGFFGAAAAKTIYITNEGEE